MLRNALAKPQVSQLSGDHHWIHRNQLEIGMYVVELDVPWEKTPFMFQGFYIEDKAQIAAVQAECEYLLVKSTMVKQRSRR